MSNFVVAQITGKRGFFLLLVVEPGVYRSLATFLDKNAAEIFCEQTGVELLAHEI